MRNRLFWSLFGIVLLIGILHWTGINYFLYWRWWWYDIVLHFLGGLWVALATLWFGHFSDYIPSLEKRRLNFFLVAVLSALIIGIGWEIFEYINGLTFDPFGESYANDALSDLGMDFIGGLTAYLYYSRRLA